MNFSRLLNCAALVSFVNSQKILDIIRGDLELQTLSSIIKGTGAGLPNPDIEDWFEIVKPGRTSTFLAPTTEAFERIPKAALAQLEILQNYPILLSLIRNHLIGHQNNTSLFSSSYGEKTITSSEGTLFLLSTTNSKSFISSGYYKSEVFPEWVKTTNGAYVHKISRLIDPYGSIYGFSSSIDRPTFIDNTTRQTDKTMMDIVLSEPGLKIWKDFMTEIFPASFKHLDDRVGPEGQTCQTPHSIAMLPINSAFDLLPEIFMKKLKAPFNFALSSYLLAWGITVPTCASLDDILFEIKTKGKFDILSQKADFNLTITEVPLGSGELMVNNARVMVADKCAGNGCIWIMDRFIDPVFGLF